MPLTEKEIDFLERLLNRIQASYKTFRVELIVYNVCCAAAGLLVVYSAWVSATRGENDAMSLGTYFVSGGLFAATVGRITSFLAGDLKTLNKIIDKILNQGGQT